MDKDNRSFKAVDQQVQDILRAIDTIKPVVPMIRKRESEKNFFLIRKEEEQTFTVEIGSIEKTLQLFPNEDLKALLSKRKDLLKLTTDLKNSLETSMYALDIEINQYYYYAECVYLTDSIFRELVQLYNTKWPMDKFLAMLLIISQKTSQRSTSYSVRWAKNHLLEKMKSQKMTKTAKKRIAILESIEIEGDDYFDQIIEYIKKH